MTIPTNPSGFSSIENSYRLIVEAVKDYAIFMLDREGRVATWNAGAQRIKGYDRSDVVGKHFSLFYKQEDIARNHPQNELSVAIAEGRYEEEGWRVRKDGTQFWANVVITRVDNENGEVVGFAKVTRDLTERKKAEENLRQANESLERRVIERTLELERALSSRDEFLSIASHELKTPLTSLKLQLQVLRRRVRPDANTTPSPQNIADAVDLGIRQVNSLSQLIDDLLDVSRIQTGNFELHIAPTNISRTVEDIAARFSQQMMAAGCTLELDLDHKARGHWDEYRLEQVLINFLSNAIKYAPKKPVRIRTQLLGEKVTLMVQDFGLGIEPEKQGKIFERFERVNSDRHIGGLGLGLFIVKKIIDAHNGKVWVESELGQGSKFFVELPLTISG